MLRFLEPAGARTGKLLPTGRPLDDIEGVPTTCIDFGNPVVLLKACDLGKTGYETKQALDADGELLARLEAMRETAAERMGMDPSNTGLPKVVLIAPPRAGGTLASRYFSPSRSSEGLPRIPAATVVTTARPLFTGIAFVPDRVSLL